MTKQPGGGWGQDAKRQRIDSDTSGDADACDAIKLDTHGRVHVRGLAPPGECHGAWSGVGDFRIPNAAALLAALAADAELSAAKPLEGGAYSEGGTYWVGAAAAAASPPRTAAEAYALAVFKLHARGDYDPARSGAEWWTQCVDGLDDIGPHWDRDYEVEGAGMNLHPFVSTVTYACAGGAPTLVASLASPFAHGAVPGTTTSADRAWLSHPTPGKHIVFDGRYLHAAPSALQHAPPKGKRITFLVNVWLNWKPLNAEPWGAAAAAGAGAGGASASASASAAAAAAPAAAPALAPLEADARAAIEALPALQPAAGRGVGTDNPTAFPFDFVEADHQQVFEVCVPSAARAAPAADGETTTWACAGPVSACVRVGEALSSDESGSESGSESGGSESGGSESGSESGSDGGDDDDGVWPCFRGAPAGTCVGPF